MSVFALHTYVRPKRGTCPCAASPSNGAAAFDLSGVAYVTGGPLKDDDGYEWWQVIDMAERGVTRWVVGSNIEPVPEP